MSDEISREAIIKAFWSKAEFLTTSLIDGKYYARVDNQPDWPGCGLGITPEEALAEQAKLDASDEITYEMVEAAWKCSHEKDFWHRVLQGQDLRTVIKEMIVAALAASKK